MGAVVKHDEHPDQEPGRWDHEGHCYQRRDAQHQVHCQAQRQIRHCGGGDVEQSAPETRLGVNGQRLLPRRAAPYDRHCGLRYRRSPTRMPPRPPLGAGAKRPLRARALTGRVLHARRSPTTTGGQPDRDWAHGGRVRGGARSTSIIADPHFSHTATCLSPNGDIQAQEWAGPVWARAEWQRCSSARLDRPPYGCPWKAPGRKRCKLREGRPLPGPARRGPQRRPTNLNLRRPRILHHALAAP